MSQMRWDGGTAYELVFEGSCEAPPEVVYAVLADLSTHLEWAGRRQYPGFRLASLEGSGPIQVGTEFDSVGQIPMATSRFRNRNTVVEARPAQVLAFYTESTIDWRSGRRSEASYEHRYGIEPAGTGSRVVYRLHQTRFRNPPLRARVPLMRTVTHRVMIPFLCGRGFRNLLRLAERSAAGADGRASFTA